MTALLTHISIFGYSCQKNPKNSNPISCSDITGSSDGSLTGSFSVAVTFKEQQLQKFGLSQGEFLTSGQSDVND